ncbi:MAG TPA: hypothetical protein PKC39_09290 [Ferruginibacter sp.]|nr:hypothetical protein [Ferruginibacter sp.]HMP21140.1 hypothetical protein [Ferruginibacter sp.]
MQKVLYILLLFYCTCSCTVRQGDGPTAPGYTWTKVLDSAAWSKSYNYQLVALRDTLWVLHPEGNWYSTDAAVWVKSSLPNSIGNLAFLDYVLYNEALYGLGYFRGNIEQYIFKPEIYCSRDMRTWQLLSRTSNLPQRFFYHPFVFENKIWIIGGEDQDKQYDDIWCSADAVTWVKQKSKATPGKQSGSQVLQFKGKLYLLNNDVWTSADGIKWEKLTSEILQDTRLSGYTAVVFDDKIWLLGCTRNQQFTSKTLYSEDGTNWKEADAPWSARGGVAACVFKGKLYMTGGKYGGTSGSPEFVYSNDLWVMEKSE